jgi:hypothetical protein
MDVHMMHEVAYTTWLHGRVHQIQTYLHMKLSTHIRNTVKLSIVCSDSWHHRDYSFTLSQEQDGLRCACKMNAWVPHSDTILNQLIVPANSWQSCHILLCNPLSNLLTRHRRQCGTQSSMGSIQQVCEVVILRDTVQRPPEALWCNRFFVLRLP